MKRYSYLILVLICIIFVFNQILPSLETPDINPDEAFIGRASLDIINNVKIGGAVSFLGRWLPYAVTGHHGALEVYLFAPSIYLCGPTLKSLRIPTVVVGVIIILLCYIFTAMLFGSSVGFLACFLLAIDTAFIHYLKMGGVYGFTIPIFTLLSLILFFKWHITKKEIFLYLGMFCLGLGWNAKGWFIWFILAVFITALFLYIPRNRIKIREYLFGPLSFLLGAFPIIYQYSTGGLSIFSNHFVCTVGGVNNFTFFSNLCVRIRELSHLLRGVYYEPPNAIFVASFFLISFFYLILQIFFAHTKKLTKNRIVYLVMISFLTFLFSTVTFTEHRPGHLLILYPYLQIIVAVAIFEAVAFLNHRRISILLIFLSIFYIMQHSISSYKRYESLKCESDKISTCNLYILTQWLMKNRADSLVTFYFTSAPIMFYSDLHMETDFNRLGREDKVDLKKAMFNSHGTKYYIFDRQLDREMFAFFCKNAKESKRKIVKEKGFKLADGTVKYEVYSLR